MSQQIKVLEMGDVRVGMRICDVDDDSPAYGSIVDPRDYSVLDQEWCKVLKVGGPVDLPTFDLEWRNGHVESARYQASATVWVLADEAGEPVLA